MIMYIFNYRTIQKFLEDINKTISHKNIEFRYILER